MNSNLYCSMAHGNNGNSTHHSNDIHENNDFSDRLPAMASLSHSFALENDADCWHIKGAKLQVSH